jgi:hypothetical protein
MQNQNPGVAILHRQTASKIADILEQAGKKETDLFYLYRKDFAKFNNMIGLPLHPETLKPSPILDYQLTYNKIWVNHHKVILNKSRKIGATETALRTICQQCFSTYVGHNVMIVAGNRQRQANKFLEKFNELFYGHNDKGWKWGKGDNDIVKYTDLVDSYRANHMRLTNGVQIETYPASPLAVRGPENVKCVFVSEAAHVNRIEDGELYTALRPLAANDPNVDFILESTPNGKRGFFYDQFKDKNNGFEKLEFNYEWALHKLLTPKFIEEERRNPKIDFEQEYNCKFTSTLSAAFDMDMVDKNYQPAPIKRWEHIVKAVKP